MMGEVLQFWEKVGECALTKGGEVVGHHQGSLTYAFNCPYNRNS
jgi:hypothetical protein